VSTEVKHEGIVKEIVGDKVHVSIIAKSACLSCQVKGACNISEMTEKIIEVNRYDVNFNIGESVIVALKETSGFKALFIGYLIPFFILLATLIITSSITENEIIVGLSSLVILVPYYFFLFILRDKLKKQFSFFIHKR
jgi:sigma-E factor negative regulatory protein RseC